MNTEEDEFKRIEAEAKRRVQEPMAWKLVPTEPTNEMLKAMDECSTEGYDERLYAGHAASVYMAAVDVAPTPPQRTWVGLTPTQVKLLWEGVPEEAIKSGDSVNWIFYTHINEALKERNT